MHAANLSFFLFALVAFFFFFFSSKIFSSFVDGREKFHVEFCADSDRTLMDRETRPNSLDWSSFSSKDGLPDNRLWAYRAISLGRQ